MRFSHFSAANCNGLRKSSRPARVSALRMLSQAKSGGRLWLELPARRLRPKQGPTSCCPVVQSECRARSGKTTHNASGFLVRMLGRRADAQPKSSTIIAVVSAHDLLVRIWSPSNPRRSSLLPGRRPRISLIVVNKVLLALLALVLAVHAGIGCGVAQAALAIEAPCCGKSCPVGSAIGESACCHAQDSGAAAQEISRSSIPAVQSLVGLMRLSVISPVRTAMEQASLFQGSPPGAAKLALLCSRQI